MSRLVINRIVIAFCFILIPPFLSVADIQRFLQIVRKSTGDPDDGSGFLIICEQHKQRQENTPGSDSFRSSGKAPAIRMMGADFSLFVNSISKDRKTLQDIFPFVFRINHSAVHFSPFSMKHCADRLHHFLQVDRLCNVSLHARLLCRLFIFFECVCCHRYDRNFCQLRVI